MSNSSSNPSQSPPQRQTEASNPQAQAQLTCTLCQAAFASRNQLFRHIRQQHLGGSDDSSNNFPASLYDTWTPGDRTAASVEARSHYRNAAHDAYYRAQVTRGTAWTMSEWELASAKFRQPLPVAFRVLLAPRSALENNSSDDDVRWQFWQQLVQGVPPGSLQPAFETFLPCCKTAMAYTAVIPPRQWSPAAQQALMDAQHVGVVNRQELSSMIPPLLLLWNNAGGNSSSSSSNNNDVSKSGLSILDLCAAPGSKSLQLMDMMHHLQYFDKTASTTTSKNATTPSNVMLVCNDANRQRLVTVARRSRRQPSHYRPCLVLNSSDGRYFPTLRKWSGYRVKFSHVLADVPCSGDGTLRKLSQTQWHKWNVKEHLQLHKLQVRLLARALEMVQKGGRVVYSTCSLDPMEDEAVVVSAMARMGGPTAYRIVPIPSTTSSRQSTTTADKSQSLPLFPHSPGATRWIVPHPEFGKVIKKRKNNNNDDDDTVNDETYEFLHQVPAALRKKEISPTMFPPRARTREYLQQVFQNDTLNMNHSDNDNNNNNNNNTYVEEKLEQARRFGELLSANDIESFEQMLPNCARIFPHHLDSGGFFCAIIERVAPAYYPVCYPLQRQQPIAPNQERDNDSAAAGAATTDNDCGQQQKPQQTQEYRYHGRILYPVESSRQVRDLVAEDKAQGVEVYFEGVATKELAIEWLKMHRAYLPGGMSEQLLVPPSVTAPETKINDRDNDDNSTSNTAGKKEKSRYVLTRPPLYTPMFRKPHPSLIEEFCDFFGLFSDPEKATLAAVEPFPVNNLIVVGGGDEAVNVTTCVDPETAHILVPTGSIKKNTIEKNNIKIPRKRRFLQLTLISDEVKSLFKGGATFNPIEVGLALCWVPVPGLYRDQSYEDDAATIMSTVTSTTATSSNAAKQEQSPPVPDYIDGDSSGGQEGARFEDATSRALHSGRYGLLDEAAEYLGRCATKRIVALTLDEALQLLKTSRLKVPEHSGSGSGPPAYSSDPEAGNSESKVTTCWGKWGKQQLIDLGDWSLGATIAVVLCGHVQKDVIGKPLSSTLFLPCVLKVTEEERHVELLSEQRLTEAWTRLLESIRR